MNNKGQLLLCDIILAIFIIFIIVICMTYIIEEEDTPKSYSEAQDTINLLASTRVHDTNLLEALSEDDDTAKEVALSILSEKKYTLKDLTLNKTLSQIKSSSYHDVSTARKIVGSKEYELSIYT